MAAVIKAGFVRRAELGMLRHFLRQAFYRQRKAYLVKMKAVYRGATTDESAARMAKAS